MTEIVDANQKAGSSTTSPSGEVDHFYFPTTAVFSISCMMTDGWADALTLIGREGFASVEVFLGSDSVSCHAVVLSEGWGYRIRRGTLNQVCKRSGSMRSVLLRYAQSYIAQVAQTIVCNRHHAIDQQLCRWRLMFLDRRASNELPLTHDQIAELMGVRRESVTEAARELQIARYIRYQRGRISVIDRTGLEGRSCECYGIGKRETARLLEMSQSAQMAATQAPGDWVRNGRSESFTAHASPNFA
jgi:CRP-like cAMP-binding protein